MARQFRPGNAQAEMHRRQPPLLFVGRTNGGPLVVTEQGNVGGTRPVPFGELPWTAHVHQRTLMGPKFLYRK